MAVALLAMIPLVYVATYIVLIGPAEIWDLVVRPRILDLLRNTVTLAAATMAATAALGIALAFLVERTDLPARRLWHGLLVAPLAVPAFVNGYAWVSLDRSINGFGGAWLVVTLSYYPLVYLPAVATLRGLDPALEEASWSLGNTRWQTFTRVVLPQLRPALLGGALLVGLHLLSEFGALALLRFPTFTTAIYDQYGSTFNGSAATAMAGVLVLLCLFLLLAELRLRGSRHYARVGQGAARLVRAAGAARPALAAAAPGHGARRARARRADVRPAALAGGGHLHGVPPRRAALAPPARRWSWPGWVPWPRRWRRSRWRGSRCATAAGSRRSSSAARTSPTPCPASSSASRWSWPACAWCPSSTRPRCCSSWPTRSSSCRVPWSRCARAWSRRRWCSTTWRRASAPARIATARRVTLPLIAPSLGAGAALVFLAISTELTATLMLSPIGTRTLATEFWSASSELRYGAAAPYALLLVLISVPATVLLMRQERLHP